jgi:hypothetical protein
VYSGEVEDGSGRFSGEETRMMGLVRGDQGFGRDYGTAS